MIQDERKMRPSRHSSGPILSARCSTARIAKLSVLGIKIRNSFREESRRQSKVHTWRTGLSRSSHLHGTRYREKRGNTVGRRSHPRTHPTLIGSPEIHSLRFWHCVITACRMRRRNATLISIGKKK
jgi:hypothetical protein